jgi:hypothetical protein
MIFDRCCGFTVGIIQAGEIRIMIMSIAPSSNTTKIAVPIVLCVGVFLCFSLDMRLPYLN